MTPIELAELGYPIFPVISGEKRPATAHGFHDATTDAEAIAAWADDYAGCNVGLACAGLVVVDIDDMNSPWYAEHLAQLDDSAGGIVQTPRGGRHYYYGAADKRGSQIIERAKDWRDLRQGEKDHASVETRGTGGYVLVPPSYTADGEYVWLRPLWPRETLPDVPDYVAPVKTQDAPQSQSTRDYRPVTVYGDYSGEGSVADDYNARVNFRQALESAGWKLAGPGSDGNEQWTRPGKKSGCSATLKDGVLYVFSSATELEPNRGYSAFGFYSATYHGGDHRAATRALADAGYGPERGTVPGVDLSDLLASLLPDVDDDDTTDAADPGRMPRALYDVPGFMRAYQQWTLRCAPYPCPEASFFGALSLLSYLTGRKVQTAGGLRTNIYLALVASSGTGKDLPRKANAVVMSRLQRSEDHVTLMSSSEGIEDALQRSPCCLWQVDEFDDLMMKMGDAKDSGGRWQSISAILRSLYTSSDTLYPCRRRAAYRGQQVVAEIDQPHLVVFGTGSTTKFFASISEGSAVDGLLARFLILDPPDNERKGQVPAALDPVPEAVLAPALAWAAWTPGNGNLGDVYAKPMTVTATDDAVAILGAYRNQSDADWLAVKGATAEVYRAIIAREVATAEKLALLHAASRCADPATEPMQIDGDAQQWGCDVARYLSRRMAWHVSRHIGDGEFAQWQQRVLRSLEDAGGAMTARDCRRMLRVKPHDYDAVIQSLVGQERIEHCQVKAKRRTTDGYRLLRGKR